MEITAEISSETITDFLIINNNKDIHDYIKLLNNVYAQKYFKYHLKTLSNIIAIGFGLVKDENEFNIFLLQVYSYKLVIESKSFHEHFFHTIFPSLIKANLQINSKNVFQETSRFLYKSIINKNLLAIESHLMGEAKVSYPAEYRLCKLLFNELKKLYSTDLSVSCCGFTLLFNSFCYADSFKIVYKFFSCLVDMLGFQVRNDFKFKIKTDIENLTFKRSIIILASIYERLATVKVQTDCQISNIKFTNFIRDLLQSILATTNKLDNSICKIILLNIDIDPLNVEHLIADLIAYTMFANEESYKDSSNLKIYENVVIKILEVYKRLHRFPNFISSLVLTIKANLLKRKQIDAKYKYVHPLEFESTNTCTVDNIFPVAVINYFSNCLINLASWQIINILKTLIFHLKEALEEIKNQELDSFTLIELLTTLLSCFLQSVRIAEHAVTTSSVAKFVIALEELRSILGGFGKVIIHREHSHILMRSFLNICYAWGEVYMLLDYYSIDAVPKIQRTIDDYAACNLTYLHSYLESADWCLIFERITNFGEKSYKITMDKLMVQKLRTIFIYENTINDNISSPIIKHLSVSGNIQSFITDRFFEKYLLPKFSESIIINYCNLLVDEVIEKKNQQLLLVDSEIITKGIVTILLRKIASLLKQKRKADENALRKSVYLKYLKLLPSGIFPSNDTVTIQDNDISLLLFDSIFDNTTQLDLNINQDNFVKYIDLLKSIPILHFNKETNKTFIILMILLHRDFDNSNCANAVKFACENIILSIIKYRKFDFFEIIDFNNLFKFAFRFQFFEDVLDCMLNVVFKSNDLINRFNDVVDEVANNLEKDNYLKGSVVLLNNLSKVKRSKLPAEAKKVCLNYRLNLMEKLLKLLLKHKPEAKYVSSYIMVLNFVSVQHDEEKIKNLTTLLQDYIDYSFTNVTNDNIRDSLHLHKTILSNRLLLTMVSADYTTNVWNSLQNLDISSDNVQEYCALNVLITVQASNEVFKQILNDLLQLTIKSISGPNENFLRYINNWNSIISTNYNTIKEKTIQEHLELLMEKIVLTLKFTQMQENFLQAVCSFFLSIIQTSQFLLTPAITDIFFLLISIIYSKKLKNCIQSHNLSISILENLLKYRTALILDRLPPFLQQYRIVLMKVCIDGNLDRDLDAFEVQKIADSAYALEKLTKNLVSHSKDMARISLYLVADILNQYQTVALYPEVKVHLNNCIYNLLSLCDEHAVQYLMRVLNSSSTESFKIMYENFKKYYKFSGKV